MAKKLHIDNWIAKAEPDYYTMFIKAWIPFNAWYFTEFETTQDKEALRKIKNSKNKIRNRIEALLKNKDRESTYFRSYIAHLHKELKDRTILNYDSPLSFESIKLDEYFPEPATKYIGDIIYKIIPNRTTGFKVQIVTKDQSKTYMDKTFNPYSLESLVVENQFICLSKEMQNEIKLLFVDVDPKKPFSLVVDKEEPDSILLDEELKIFFLNDTELIAKSLLQILYELRCLLFHGILDPTEINHSIYEHAFNILKPLIKELK